MKLLICRDSGSLFPLPHSNQCGNTYRDKFCKRGKKQASSLHSLLIITEWESKRKNKWLVGFHMQRGWRQLIELRNLAVYPLLILHIRVCFEWNLDWWMRWMNNLITKWSKDRHLNKVIERKSLIETLAGERRA